MALLSTSAFDSYGSTECFSTAGLSAAAAQYQQSRYQQLLGMRQQDMYRQLAGQLSQGTATVTSSVPVTPVKKGVSMVDEFKSYIREYKDWIFTMAIIAIIDHFFLDGALKEKLSAALGKKLDTHGDVKA